VKYGKDFRPLVHALIKAGCTIEDSRAGGHVKVYRDGRLVGTLSSSPSNRSAHKKARSDFRRQGVLK
jgi:hypothetical protein